MPVAPGYWLTLSTGLIWEKTEDLAEFKWANAKTHCTELSQNGFYDWRLPTVVELESLFDFTKQHAADFWSSTSLADYTGAAWSVSFWSGRRLGNSMNEPLRVRCVHTLNSI